jgi:hypothetical protein
MATNEEVQATAAEALRDLASGFYTVGGAASLANKPLTLLHSKHCSKETGTKP